MTKTRKIFIAILSMIFVVCMSMFVFTACTPVEKPELSSIKITTPPTTTSYVSGSTFDATGMVVTANYVDETQKVLTSDDWTFEDPGKLTVAAGKFESSKIIKISYTEGEITKTANQNIKIHNFITAATVATYPNQEYFIGQSFNLSGMTVNAMLEDGTKTTVEVTDSNATYAPTGALSANVKEVAVTVGGFEIKVPVSVLNAIYVEAETGYRNGALIDQSDGDSGNIRTDATTELAKTGAENLFKAQLKADFVLEQIKKADGYDATALAQPSDTVTVTVGGKVITKEYDAIVAWLAAEENQKAINDYVASDEFKAAVDKYLASAQFVEDYMHYVAHEESEGAGENYLGQNGQGDVLSFVFDSSAATKGSIAFRLASAYLFRDNNGGWKSVIMGDVQFNKLCEFYINGVKAEIDDSVLLEGGMTADGSADNVLWCNWKEVQFSNVDFVEGRNVIELRFLHHGIVAANGYNFAANIDTLLVAPVEGSSVQLNTFDNTNVKIEYTLSNVAIAEGKLNVAGTLSGASKGYYGDLLNVMVGTTYADLTLDGNNFSATLDLSKIEASETAYSITVGGSAISAATEGTATIGWNTYTLSEDGQLTVTSEASLEFVPTAADIAEVDGKAYFYITGTYTAVNYTEDEIKAIIAASYFDLQNDGSHSKATSTGWDSTKFTSTVADVTLGTETVDGATVYPYKVGFDVTSLAASAYVSHYNPGGTTATDFKPGIDVNKEIIVGTMKYTLVIIAEDVGDNAELFWNCPGLIIEDTAAAVYEIKGLALEVKDDKVYLVYTGTSKNYTQDTFATAIGSVYFDCGDNNTITVSSVTMDADGNFTIYLDITNVPTGLQWLHINETGTNVNFGTIDENKKTVTYNGRTYTLTDQDEWNTGGRKVNIEAAA